MLYYRYVPGTGLVQLRERLALVRNPGKPLPEAGASAAGPRGTRGREPHSSLREQLMQGRGGVNTLTRLRKRERRCVVGKEGRRTARTEVKPKRQGRSRARPRACSGSEKASDSQTVCRGTPALLYTVMDAQRKRVLWQNAFGKL